MVNRASLIAAALGQDSARATLEPAVDQPFTSDPIEDNLPSLLWPESSRMASMRVKEAESSAAGSSRQKHVPESHMRNGDASSSVFETQSTRDVSPSTFRQR